MFEIQSMDPLRYREQTRRSTLILCAILAALCITLATLSVALFGEPGGNNFRWNLGGVIAGLLLTIAVVRTYLWQQPWMAPAVYGFRLKRNLMKVTNILHQVEAGVADADPTAMRVLRFYHLGLLQMYQLDGNSTAASDLVKEMDQHHERMLTAGLDPHQPRLDPAWLTSVSERWRDAKRR
ncbi:hypothetical protein BN1049_01035 [Pseudomonas saudimassiliensis]|uniref:DUF3087 domain-containing protein n=1 Tax=Pseudomonas saudimassiliensis TaxID=1461581 RepID=A0A078MAF8_9PSED|nr:DUF3087 domain-containing protein [Pseudomonas saudimassiliensis]CEA03199.1 hypothetical protein BN1049_01035 [Pseudomonas saudimassiliensis]CEF26112.1 hypothetical protein BN1049_01035 [Pseudomonas saudimassiliensis]